MMSDPDKVQSTLKKWHVYSRKTYLFRSTRSASGLIRFYCGYQRRYFDLNPTMEDFLYRAMIEHVESAIYSSLILDRLTKEMADKDTDFMYLV